MRRPTVEGGRAVSRQPGGFRPGSCTPSSTAVHAEERPRQRLVELREEAATAHGGAATAGGLALRTAQTNGGALLVALAGELDLATAPQLEAELLRAADASQDVTIDLAGLSFFDSTGLTLLLRAAERARDGAGALALVAPATCVREVVEVTATADALPFAPE